MVPAQGLRYKKTNIAGKYIVRRATIGGRGEGSSEMKLFYHKDNSSIKDSQGWLIPAHKPGIYRNNQGDLVIVNRIYPRHEIPMEIGINYVFSLRHSGNQDYFFRCTFSAQEDKRVNEIISINHIDGSREQGLSVSQSPGYQSWGSYPYIYVVSGKIVGTGSDGEPVLKPGTIKALSKPAKSLGKKWQEKYETDCQVGNPFNAQEMELLSGAFYGKFEELESIDWKEWNFVKGI